MVDDVDDNDDDVFDEDDNEDGGIVGGDNDDDDVDNEMFIVDVVDCGDLTASTEFLSSVKLFDEAATSEFGVICVPESMWFATFNCLLYGMFSLGLVLLPSHNEGRIV